MVISFINKNRFVFLFLVYVLGRHYRFDDCLISHLLPPQFIHPFPFSRQSSCLAQSSFGFYLHVPIPCLFDGSLATRFDNNRKNPASV
jgi:hypothetical protein